jgi:D-alanine-D-alanine ligase
MKKLRVLALMHESMVPPQDVSGIDVREASWKMEYDVVTTLHNLGHQTQSLGVGSDLTAIRNAMQEFKPHLAFNLLEDFHDVPIFDQNVVSYLELLRLPYTGCGPRGLMLARDKALSKKLLAYHRIPVPDFAVFPRGRKVRRPRRLEFPIIVKSLTHEASTGISQASVVTDETELKQRVRFVHDSVGGDAIGERFIEGRELYLGLLGNQRLVVFPVWEMSFDRLPERGRLIATDRVKWSDKYQKKYGIKTEEAKGLSAEQTESIQRLCKRAFRILTLNGYARIDMRMDESGKVYVLEANPNPQLAYGEDFAESAEKAGIGYQELLQRILSLGLRWRPEGPD